MNSEQTVYLNSLGLTRAWIVWLNMLPFQYMHIIKSISVKNKYVNSNTNSKSEMKAVRLLWHDISHYRPAIYGQL